MKCALRGVVRAGDEESVWERYASRLKLEEYGGLSTAAAKAPPPVEMTWWGATLCCIGTTARYDDENDENGPLPGFFSTVPVV